MPTLITAYSADGTIVGRCDARCHRARSPRCRCICSGANHGLGFANALPNVTRIIKDLARLHAGPNPLHLVLDPVAFAAFRFDLDPIHR